MRQRTNKEREFTRQLLDLARSVPSAATDQFGWPICSFLVSRQRAEVVPGLAKKGELVLHGNLSCSYVYNGCHTSFDKLLLETVATLPGGWRSVHTIRLEIEPFTELVAHSESLTGSQVDSPDSCRAKLKSAPATVLQSLLLAGKTSGARWTPTWDRCQGNLSVSL